MKQQYSEKQRVNKPSSLLSQDENELVFSLLGRRCQTMCTAAVQLYTTEAPAHSSWIKRVNGIACFVRDSSKRSYYIRIYCLAKHELVWEEEMYESIIINKSREFLISFEGQDCMIALSFATDAEASAFHKTATTNRTKRRQDRRSRKFSPPKHNDVSQDNGYESGVVLRNTAPTPTAQFSQMPQSNAFAGSMGLGNNRDRKRSNRKLTKADISMPTNFKHVVHVGWTAQKGYDLNNEEVSNLNAFLEKVGVSDEQLNDRDTRAYIYDFIQSNNVLDSVKSENEKHEPPPVPSRNNGTQRTAPPPPPTPIITRPPAQLPSTANKQTRGAPPSRPPPISDPMIQQQTTIAAPAPPPPPPPPPSLSTLPSLNTPKHSNQTVTKTDSSLPAGGGNDTRNALMESIRKGTALKKVDQTALSTSSGSDDGRNNLLKEIRQGVELRPALERELSGSQRGSTNSGRVTDALADALRRALQERSRVLRSSDEEDDSSENDEWDD